MVKPPVTPIDEPFPVMMVTSMHRAVQQPWAARPSHQSWLTGHISEHPHFGYLLSERVTVSAQYSTGREGKGWTRPDQRD